MFARLRRQTTSIRKSGHQVFNRNCRGCSNNAAENNHFVDNFKIYISNSNNPFFNIAFEQWLFNSSRQVRVLYLWRYLHTQPLYLFPKCYVYYGLHRNGPSVIIGKHQGAWKECNIAAMDRDKVNLVRRASGGGAVYQDLGNSIFTFISPKHDGKGIVENNKIITSALSFLGITGVPTGRNDIEVNGQKISGAAFKHSRDRSLHHGTLLLDVDLKALDKYLTPNKLKMESKGVSSVAARVVNLVSIVPDITHPRICDAIQTSFKSFHNINDTSCNIEYIDETFVNKNVEVAGIMSSLLDWDWRFGKEPEFSNRMETRFSWGMLDIYFVVKNGIIEKASIYSDALDVDFISAIQLGLQKVRYSEVGILDALALIRVKAIASSVNQAFVNNLDEFSEWVVKNL